MYSSFFFTVGLDAAGKTTILYKLKLGEIVTTIPTIGKELLTKELILLDISMNSLFSKTSIHRKKHVLKSQCDDVNVTHFRFQCRNCRIQKHMLHRLGCRRPRQNPTTLEALLSEHTRPDFRSRFK